MDDLNTLNAMGLTLPSPAYLFGGLVFSIIGYAAYRYGKKASLPYPKWLGVTLMLYPYAVSDAWLLYVVGAGLCVALYHFRRRRIGLPKKGIGPPRWCPSGGR